MNATRRPGEPLAVMTALLGAWVVGRIFFWQPPLAIALDHAAQAASLASSGEQTGRFSQSTMVQLNERAADPPGSAIPIVRHSVRSAPAEWEHAAVALARATASASREWSAKAAMSPSARSVSQHVGERPLEPSALAAATPLQRVSRFSGEGWILFRPGPATTLAGRPLVGRYGASQAGVTVRFRLSDSAAQPSLYARSTAGFDPLTDRELALGVSARPIPAVPLRLQAELRAREADGSLELAPAALAVSEIRPVQLPLGVQANTYLAAGYVAGSQPTPFVDAMMRIDRPVARTENAELRLGAGAWGGAQETVAALDAGPSASLRGTLGGRPVALSLDYRMRVAGSAEPRSGVAFTLSAGF